MSHATPSTGSAETLSQDRAIEQRLETRLVIWLIRFYQRRLSPLKGFRCAHRALHGRDSCSEAVLKIIQARGVWTSWKLIRQRFHECAVAARTLRTQAMAAQGDSGQTQENTSSDPPCLSTPANCMSNQTIDCCMPVLIDGCCSFVSRV